MCYNNNILKERYIRKNWYRFFDTDIDTDGKIIYGKSKINSGFDTEITVFIVCGEY